ncbi:MAG: hypothetical protein GTN78_07025 [Gemmatimonadales bacterium]|nr:hypothetical protein [Gemmatimonadales bacterium]NIQ99942.1 hypothetical protein [Gemmatimonadales bacterium]NIS64401.1 hypothetical protein [Gemmatimonadales bacterium]
MRAAACESAEGDCGVVFPAVLLSWRFIGGVAALTVEPSRYIEFPTALHFQLQPYARFPQGLPEGFRSEDPVTQATAGGSGGDRKRR